jgi:hypothetical protein
MGKVENMHTCGTDGGVLHAIGGRITSKKLVNWVVWGLIPNTGQSSLDLVFLRETKSDWDR